MIYNPRLTEREIRENHRRYSQRISLYRGKGLDFVKSREYILKKALPLNGNILELGTGKGHMTLTLAKAGYKPTSVDKDKETLKIAAMNLAYQKLLSSAKLYLMDGKSLTFKDSSFNNIIAVGFFHHVAETDRILAEMDRVLSGDGKIILADFNKNGMAVLDKVHKDEGGRHEDSGLGMEYIYSRLQGLGYAIQSHDEPYYWILIAHKRTQERPGSLE